MSKNKLEHALAFIYIALIITTVIYLYWPGLAGPFLLDDKISLEVIQPLGNINSPDKIKAFILGGSTGPSGRPISLLSFLINDNAWPTDPWGFKYTNLLLHICNALLIAWLLNLIGITLNLERKKAVNAAFISAFIWAVHPLQVSTVLYVIQRMTELSTFFMLVGLICYMKGRQAITGNPMYGFSLSIVGIMLSACLAILSKESGLLIFCYAIAIEYILLSTENGKITPKAKRYLGLAISAPLLLFLMYTGFKWREFTDIYALRDFSLAERLLTESRVIIDYFREITLPSLRNNGLYHDDYVISRSLFAPITTLFSVITIMAAAICTVKYRKTYPIMAFGAAWFLMGHSLESTVIPLELYFEHRNYLPMLGLIYAGVLLTLTQQHWRFRPAMAIIPACIFLGFLTTIYARQWSNSGEISIISAHEHPNSLRANQMLAAYHFSDRNDPRSAIKVFSDFIARNENNATARLQYIHLKCLTSGPTVRFLDESLDVFKRSVFANDTHILLLNIFRQTVKTGCKSVPLMLQAKFVETFISNPSYQNSPILADLYLVQGLIYSRLGKLDKSMMAFDKSSELKPTVDIFLTQTRTLATAGLYNEALQRLDTAEEIYHSMRKHKQKPSKLNEINTLRDVIMADIHLHDAS